MNITHVFEDVPLVGKYDAGAGYLSGHADIEFGADADWIISAVTLHGDGHGIAIEHNSPLFHIMVAQIIDRDRARIDEKVGEALIDEGAVKTTYRSEHSTIGNA